MGKGYGVEPARWLGDRRPPVKMGVVLGRHDTSSSSRDFGVFFLTIVDRATVNKLSVLLNRVA